MRNTILNKRYRANRYSLSFFLLLTSTFLLLQSCNHEDLDVYVESENYRNAADFTANNYDLSLFHAALETAGLLDTLRGEGPFTLFAPSNEAFNDLGIIRASDFRQMDRDSLRFMLLYHILPRRLYSSDVSVNTIDNPYLNLADRELLLARGLSNIGVTTFGVNGAKSPNTTVSNQILANGVLHVVDKVLKYNEGTIQQTLENRAEFSLYVQMLKHFGEWNRLSEEGPWTVMAPTNAAFENRNITSQDIQQMDVSVYHKEMLLRPYVLKNHVFTSDLAVVGSTFLGNKFGDLYVVVPVDEAEDYIHGIRSFGAGGEIGVLAFVSEKDPPEVFKGYYRQATFSSLWQTDYKSDNGIVHAINDLLVYPEDAIKE